MKKTSILLRTTEFLIFLSSIASVTNAQEVTVTAPTDQRTIIGGGDTRTFEFGVSETAANAQTVTYSPSGATVVSPEVLTGQSLDASGSTSVTVLPNYGGFTTGTNSVGLTVSDDNSGWSDASGTFNVQGIVNRAITGIYTSNNLGARRMVGSVVGTIEFDGGSTADAADVTLHDGGFASHNNGVSIVYNGGSDFTFNDATNQKATVDVKVFQSGQVTVSGFTLPSSGRVTTPNSGHVEYGGSEYATADFKTVLGTTTTRSTDSESDVENQFPAGSIGASSFPKPNAQELQDNSINLVRQGALLSGENLPGASIDLSGVGSITEDAVYLHDRHLSGGVVSLGRAMVGSGDVTVSAGSVTVSINDTNVFNNTDLTNIRLGSFSESAGAITASMDTAVDFTGSLSDTPTATVTLSTTGLTFDDATLGASTQRVNVGSAISTLENSGAGLVGESVQSFLSIGYSKTFVANNSVVASDVTVYAIEGSDLGSQPLYNRTAGSQFDDDEHTFISVDSSIDLSGSAPDSGSTSTSTIDLDGTKVTGEGLTGEVVDITKSYNVTVKGIQDMDIQTSDVNLVYGDGDSISLTNVDAASGPQATGSIIDYSSLYQDFVPFTLEFAGGDTVLGVGETSTATVNFQLADTPDDSGLGVTYVDVISLQIKSSYDGGDSNIAQIGNTFPEETLLGNRTETFQYTLSKSFETTGSTGVDGGSVELAAGADLGSQNIFYTYDNGASTGTRLDILDSALLDSAGTINIGVDELGNLGQSLQDAVFSDRVVGQVYDVTGLDGTLHVLQLNYDETGLPYEESNVRLGWFNPDENMWMHSIMGNSDVGIFTENEYSAGKFFSGSYLSYLSSIGNVDPTLGTYGVDTDNNVAWAVIDHNSSFAVIPEINSLWMLAIAFGGLLTIQQIKSRKKTR